MTTTAVTTNGRFTFTWPILLTLATVLVSTGGWVSTLKAQDTRLDQHSIKIEQDHEAIAEMKGQIMQVHDQVTNLAENLKDMKSQQQTAVNSQQVARDEQIRQGAVMSQILQELKKVGR